MFINHNEINSIFRINCQNIFYSLTIKHWHDSNLLTSIVACWLFQSKQYWFSNQYAAYTFQEWLNSLFMAQ